MQPLPRCYSHGPYYISKGILKCIPNWPFISNSYFSFPLPSHHHTWPPPPSHSCLLSESQHLINHKLFRLTHSLNLHLSPTFQLLIAAKQTSACISNKIPFQITHNPTSLPPLRRQYYWTYTVTCSAFPLQHFIRVHTEIHYTSFIQNILTARITMLTLYKHEMAER